MLVSQVKPYTTFKSNSVVRAGGSTGTDEALLMLQDPKSAVIFKKNQEIAKKASPN